MRHLICAALAAFSFDLVHAVEVAGVRFDDALRVGEGEVVANGGGVRKKAFFKVYALVLYLPSKSGDAARVLALLGAAVCRCAQRRVSGQSQRRRTGATQTSYPAL